MAVATETGSSVPAALATQDDREALERTNRMREYFAAQPKVSVKTREDEWVQINDYVFIIKGGIRVDVPKDVADLLEESGRI